MHPVPAACGHAALQCSAGVRRKSAVCSGGYTIRPYGQSQAGTVGGAPCTRGRAGRCGHRPLRESLWERKKPGPAAAGPGKGKTELLVVDGVHVLDELQDLVGVTDLVDWQTNLDFPSKPKYNNTFSIC